jgi:hypothetical protein
MAQPFQFPQNFALYPTAIVGVSTLDGRPYRFRFWPNSRANDNKCAWYVDLYTVLAMPSVLAVKLILSDDLFGDYRTAVPEVPPGRIVVRRTDEVDDEPRPPKKGEVGTRVATLGSPLLVVEYIPVNDT